MSHSPAPWSIELDFDMQGMDKVHYHIRDANNQTVCDLDIDMHKPNVRLIASAPELLEALEWTARALDREHPAAIKARVAIAKAKGEQL
jgi:hypothetical protein